jgi:prepilin-type N-terminal cleavage/methylation domain-containing protein
MKRTSGNDAGFTLVELLLAVVLLGVVMTAIGNAMIGFTRNTDATIHRLGESHDAQIAAAYFTQDVASIGVRDTDETLLQSVETRSRSRALRCGPEDGHLVVRLGWDDQTGATSSREVVVSYVVRNDAGQPQLHRLVCSPQEGQLSDIIVAHYLDTALPAVVCTDDANRIQACDGSGSEVPQSVSMVLHLRHSGDPGSTYTVSLKGTRRQTDSVAPSQQILKLLQ